MIRNSQKKSGSRPKTNHFVFGSYPTPLQNST